MGRMVGRDGVNGAVEQALHQSIDVGQGAQRRVDLAVGVVGAALDPFVGEGQVVGRDFGGDADAATFAGAHDVDAAGGTDVGDVDVCASGFSQGDVARDHDLLGGGGPAGQAQALRHCAFVHGCALSQAGFLAVVDDDAM